jgi:indolepyruvate ferredoxin oxidoreductase, beta subunit
MRPLTIAITALGGQGGGVLANWIRDLAEANGYLAQSTSVPGVAQRTGATIYYLELFPASAAEAAGREPVLSLSPVAGDVDVVIAAEWMEAGRAIQRGFVTPERTLLIASTHRAFAVAEKSAMANGIADSATVMQAAQAAARSLLCFDMQRLADSCGAVISATLFGALAAAEALPFPRSAFEAVIRGRGLVAETNMRAFALAWDRARSTEAEQQQPRAQATDAPSQSGLGKRIRDELPESAWATAWEGCRQLTDFQDAAYASLYLDRLHVVHAQDRSAGGALHGFALTTLVARHLALWMGYQDAIRVADQKTRAARYADIRREVRAAEGQLVYPVEFMHPRLEEICDILPRALGAWILRSDGLRNWLQRFFGKGRHVQTYRLGGFLMLWGLAAYRPLRRFTLRYAVEQGRIDDWLKGIGASAGASYAFALELVRCQRLLKGYSDTQERGWRNFSRIMAFAATLQPSDGNAQQLARLQAAALADEEGKALRDTFSELAALQPTAGT